VSHRWSVQVTRHLAALYLQAHQQNAASPVKLDVASSLVLWWTKLERSHVPPGSRLAASLRQQLQESRLLQHLQLCV
jgi:hypothetical protein